MLQNLEKYDVVLASNSPRRQQLLRELGVDFRVEVIKDIDECFPKDLPVGRVSQYLAELKSSAYQLKQGELLITADTIVVMDDQVLGKPSDSQQAHVMLRNLSGKTHRVITGVCVSTDCGRQSFADVTEVEFAELADEEIDYYINNYRPLDKAGAYGIQEWIGYVGVKRINGCFYNVMGLPVPRLYALLKTM